MANLKPHAVIERSGGDLGQATLVKKYFLKYFSGMNCLLPQVTKFCLKEKKKKKTPPVACFGFLVSHYKK
jgi:hypothetical protein